MRDVWLDYFRNRKEQILRLRSGDKLDCSDGYLLSGGERIGRLSNAMRDRLKELEARGYTVTDAEVSFVLAWRPREEDKEIAVCLANLVLDKRKDVSSSPSCSANSGGACR